MANKISEAVGGNRFNHYDDKRGIISGGEGTRGKTSALYVVKTAEQIADSSKCKEMRCEDSFGIPEISRGDQATNGGNSHNRTTTRDEGNTGERSGQMRGRKQSHGSLAAPKDGERGWQVVAASIADHRLLRDVPGTRRCGIG